MKYLLLIILTTFIVISCTEEQFESSKCNNIDCSDKGECYIDNDYARCNCDTGYYEQGRECVEYSCKEGYELDGTNCVKTCLDCQGDEIYTSNPCENMECSNHGYCSSDMYRVIYCLCYSGYKNEAGLSCVESDCDGVSCASK